MSDESRPCLTKPLRRRRCVAWAARPGQVCCIEPSDSSRRSALALDPMMDSHQVEGLQRCPSRGSTLSTTPLRHATEGVGRQAAYGRKSRLTDDDLAAHFVDAGSQLVLLQRKGDLVLGQLALLFAAPDLLQPASPVCAGGELSQGYVPGPVIPMLMPHQTITVGGIGHRHLEARGEFPHVQLCFHRVLSELARRFPRLKTV